MGGDLSTIFYQFDFSIKAIAFKHLNLASICLTGANFA
jgi:hypothetical protein